jgi:signal transduction histidine kinase
LGPLINLIPLLEEKETDPKKKEILGVLNNDVDYMKNLVVKTLELARLNSPNTKFTFEKINASKEIKRIIENKKSLFDEKNIEIKTNLKDDIIINADKQQFQELITNIIENAIKYNKINGKITVKSELKNNNIILSIKDAGIGLSKKHINHIFDEFYKTDNSRHDFESSGLGLSICKRIVEKHNGKIWADSPGIDKGITIFIQFPTI